MAKKLPLWTVERIQFDAHVKAFEFYQAEQRIRLGSPLKAFINRRCMELGIPYRKITSSSRIHKIAHARQLLMWEIKTQVKPEISYPELGRLFGGRDHTTCLYAVRRVEEQKARGE